MGTLPNARSPCRFTDRLRLHAAERPGDAALVDEQGELSWSALAVRVAALSGELAAEGIGAGSVVGLCLADETRHLIATLALMALASRQIVLASHDPEALRDALAARVGVTHRLDDDGVHRMGDAVPGVPEREGTLYLKTSGTTGRMNIVAFGEAQIAGQAERHADYATERLLRLASIEHNNSKRHRLYCVWAGGVNVFRRQPADVGAFCARHRVTCLDISRMHAADLAAVDDTAAFATLKVRTGGSAIPFRLRDALQRRVTKQVYVRYAATECGAIAMAGPADHDADEPSGRPLPGVELEIVDDAGVAAAHGTGGHVRLRAPGMAEGYVGDAAQTALRFRDGWFHPGDVGYLRADGQLVVQGRADDMIVLNGLNIFPAEIERVLERHPAVVEAAALPLASAVHGQIPVAAVVRRPGDGTTARELQAYARDRLGLRAPRRIVFLAQLPRNAQGKTLKRALVDAFRQRVEVPA